jgi:hypothetical protein
MPSPVRALTLITGEPASGVPARRWVNVRLDQVQPFGIGSDVYFVQDHDAVFDAQQIQYLKMFFGLGHPAIIGGHQQQHGIDAEQPRRHVVDELFVPGHIHDAYGFTRGQLEPGETQVDSHAALFFFGQAVGINAGKRFDKAGFAVVNVPGSAQGEHTSPRCPGRS